MRIFGFVAGLGLALVPVAARAVVTPFATFSPVTGTVYNVSYDSGSKTLFTSGGATPGAIGTPSSVLVNFDFLQDDPTLNAIGIQQADFTLMTASTAATAFGDAGTGFIGQDGFAGARPATGFSFLAANSFTANGVTYAAGTNLLSGSFTNATLSAEQDGSDASFRDSTPGSAGLPRTVSYTSDLLDFSRTANRGFSFDLDALAPPAQVAGSTFNSFSAAIGGTLSADAAPGVRETPAVPEPGTWAMTVVGFGVAGFAMRRRRTPRPRFA